MQLCSDLFGLCREDLQTEPHAGVFERPAGQTGAVGNEGEIQEVRRSIEGASGCTENRQASRANPALDVVAREILNAVRVGEDATKRRVLFLDVTVPGQGDVRIRLRRDGDGMEVRMRADNDELARNLRSGSDELRERGRDEGINFTSVRVVR